MFFSELEFDPLVSDGDLYVDLSIHRKHIHPRERILTYLVSVNDVPQLYLVGGRQSDSPQPVQCLPSVPFIVHGVFLYDRV